MPVQDDLREIFAAGLAAADPADAVRRSLVIEGGSISVGRRAFEDRLVLVDLVQREPHRGVGLALAHDLD